MSSGSWLGHGSAAEEGIGTTPGLMGPEEKLFLGWLDHSTVQAGSTGDFVLNPAQLQAEGKDQAVRVNLPDKTTTTDYTAPSSGTKAWWTGSADNLNESLTHAVPAQSRVTVTANAWYDIEADYDFLYGEYSTDGGKTWTVRRACAQRSSRVGAGALLLRRRRPGIAVPLQVPDRRRRPQRRVPSLTT